MNTVKEEVVKLLEYVRENEVKIKSRYAYANASNIAVAASMNLISNINTRQEVVNQWLVTVDGLFYLERTD